MKLKIEKTFSDKYTGDHYETGKEIEFKEDRAAELLADKRGLVSKVEVVVDEPPKKPRNTKKK